MACVDGFCSELSYAGVHLPLQTVESEVMLNQRLALEDTKIITHERPYIQGTNNLQGVAYPFRHPHHHVKLGEYFYPTGAARWSEFNCLITREMYDEIAGEVLGESGPALGDFVMQSCTEDDEVLIQTPLYALPVRIIAIEPDGLDLFLLTLVDQRYYWQYSQCSLEITCGMSWYSCFHAVAGCLGIHLTIDTIDPRYITPEPASDLNQPHENGAVLLEALCWNTGLVLVRNLDDTYHAMSNATANEIQAANMPDLPVIAGGDIFEDV